MQGAVKEAEQTWIQLRSFQRIFGKCSPPMIIKIFRSLKEQLYF